MTKKQQTIILCSGAAITLAVAVPLVVVAYKRHKIGMATTINKTTDMSLPRGYRNNNPLNIRVSKETWLGKITPNTDGAFEQFKSMGYGFRAALKLLRNYISNGNNTIEKMISRWAPATENNTSGYISRVASGSGINSKTVISADDREALVSIAYQMAIVENGSKPEMSDIYAGWEML